MLTCIHTRFHVLTHTYTYILIYIYIYICSHLDFLLFTYVHTVYFYIHINIFLCTCVTNQSLLLLPSENIYLLDPVLSFHDDNDELYNFLVILMLGHILLTTKLIKM